MTAEIIKEEIFRMIYVGVFGVALTALFGYILRQPLFAHWGGETLMSVPSAICFVLIAAAHIIDTTIKLAILRGSRNDSEA